MRSLACIAAALASLSLIACTGTVQGPGGPAASTPDAAPSSSTADAPTNSAEIDVTGKTLDYFTSTALPTVAYATDGIQPAMTGSSGADGSFKLANVPPASVFFVSVTADPNNYRPTRQDSIVVKDASVQAMLYAVSKVDTQRQYVSLGLAPTAGTAILVVNLLLPDGVTSLEGVPPTGITLVDGKGVAVTGVKGPFFFGPNGDLVPIAMTGVSTKYNGSARVAYLDVPPGAWTFNVSYTPAGAAAPSTMTIPAMTLADGVTLGSTGKPAATGGTGTGTGGGGGMPTFTKDIYPMLQTAAMGGQGCANCHNATMLAGGLAYDGAAADVYTKIMAAPGVVVTATPATSLMLSYPLYENPPDNHPNATWLTNLDPAYVKIQAWITGGAKQ